VSDTVAQDKDRQRHLDALFYCWLAGTVFTIGSLASLLNAPGMFLGLGISAFVAALITACDEPSAFSSNQETSK